MARQTTDSSSNANGGRDGVRSSLQETTNRVSEAQADTKLLEHVDKKARHDETPVSSVVIEHLPSPGQVGIEPDMIRLCATISNDLYLVENSNDPSSPTSFADTPEGLEDYLNKTTLFKNNINVRFIDDGIHFPGIPSEFQLKTPFTAIVTGTTLILAWRGTASFMDVVADLEFTSNAPWEKSMPSLELQSKYYQKVLQNLKDHESDLLRCVNGATTGGSSNDTPPIERIILTGHSLGGGLAQVAHVMLTVPNQEEGTNNKLATALAEKGVDIRTLAFSAPMSIALASNPSNQAVLDYLEHTVRPNMWNIFYGTDAVPHGYGDVSFLNDFVDALVDDEVNNLITNPVARRFARNFFRFHNGIAKADTKSFEQMIRYRHMGRIIHYPDASSEPSVYIDAGFNGSGPYKPGPGEKKLRDLIFKASSKAVIATEKFNHSAAVCGLAFPTQSGTSTF